MAFQPTLSGTFQIEAFSLFDTITLDCIGHRDRQGWSLKVCGEAGGPSIPPCADLVRCGNRRS